MGEWEVTHMNMGESSLLEHEWEITWTSMSENPSKLHTFSSWSNLEVNVTPGRNIVTSPIVLKNGARGESRLRWSIHLDACMYENTINSHSLYIYNRK